MADRPNILLIVLDTARADAFEPYGAPPGSSPALAQLASNGLTLHGRANACWTLPSHAAMFTGLLPRRSGLVRMPGDQLSSCREPLHANQDRLLPEVFQAAGYETKAVSANLWISPATGFDRGFNEFVAVDTGRQSGIHGESRRERARWLAEGARAAVDDGAGEAEAALERWIGERAGFSASSMGATGTAGGSASAAMGGGDASPPFFWFVNLIEAHSPYLPPRPYNDLTLRDRVKAADEARRYLNLGAIWKACAGGFEVPADALERMRHLYAASIRLMDDWLGRLLERLDASGLLADTAVVVTADHGENFGESGLMGHSFSLDERLTRVPLVWSGPGMPVRERPVGLAELPALFAEAAGLETHPWETDAPDSPVVAEFDPPTGRDDPRVATALADWGLGEDAIPLITSHLTSAVKDGVKLVAGEHTGEAGERISTEAIFELERDPLETDPISGPQAAEHPAYAELIAAVEQSWTDGARRAEMNDAAPTESARDAAPEISDEERAALEERMRLLGYM